MFFMARMENISTDMIIVANRKKYRCIYIRRSGGETRGLEEQIRRCGPKGQQVKNRIPTTQREQEQHQVDGIRWLCIC